MEAQQKLGKFLGILGYPPKYISQLGRVVSTKNNEKSGADGLRWKFEWTGIVFHKELGFAEEKQQGKRDM